MEYLFIYGLQMADGLKTMLELTIFVSAVLIAASIIFYYTNYDEITADNWGEAYKNTFKALKNTTIVFVIVSIFMGLLPTKQTLLLMGGTYLGKKAAKEIVTSQKLEKVNTIIDLQLDKYIKELKTGL